MSVCAPPLVAIGRIAHQLAGDVPFAAAADDAAVPRPAIVDDRDAIELLLLGKVDFAITSVPPSPRDVQSGLQSTTLGVELFALIVADDSPVRGLTRSGVHQLLTGTGGDLCHLGFNRGPVALGVPLARETRERAARALLPGDTIAPDVVPVDGDRGAVELLARDPRSIAIVHVAALDRFAGIRVLPIDATQPTVAAFALGAYPAGIPLLLVTAGPPRGLAASLRDALAAGELVLAADRLCLPH